MSRIRTLLAVGLLGAVAAAPPLHSREAQAAVKAHVHRRTYWDLGFFTWIRLVPGEAGALPNEHPALLAPEAIQQKLGAIRVQLEDGAEPLFFPQELAELAKPLREALSLAEPGEDLLLVSSSRRGAGLLSAPLTLTARLFVKDGALQVILRDVRHNYADAFHGTNVQPEFPFGSRSKPSQAEMRCEGALRTRPDWLAFPLDGLRAPAAPVPAPVVPQPAAETPAPRALSPAAAPAAAPAPSGNRDSAFYRAQEERLRSLKRLRDENLITEDEYQAKRQEILKGF